MPTYSYRCPEGHLKEEVFSMSSYPREVTCGCGDTAKIIIRYAPHFSVEYEERGYNLGAGRYFANRAERKEWLRETGQREVCPEDTARERQYFNDCREAAKDGAPFPDAPDAALRRREREEFKERQYAQVKEVAARTIAALEA